MKSLVNECLIEHECGESFFDAIDEKLRDDEKLINMMIDKVKENEDFDYIIVSGKFGSVFYEYASNYQDDLKEKIIVVNGGLRKDNVITSFWENFNIQNKRIVFIDDSYYLGRTRNKIKEAISDGGLRDFDVHFMERVYECPFEVEVRKLEDAPRSTCQTSTQ